MIFEIFSVSATFRGNYASQGNLKKRSNNPQIYIHSNKINNNFCIIVNKKILI